MRDFSEAIQSSGRSYRFLFSKTITPVGDKFFVTTHLDGNSIKFEMRPEQDSWRISPPVPQWIESIETELSQTIRSKVSRPDIAKDFSIY